MSVTIPINKKLYLEAKKVASTECRSIPNQIEFWARLGKCALDNTDVPIEFIKEVLIAKNTDKSLAQPFNFENEDDEHSS